MLNRDSGFQKALDKKETLKNEVLEKSFHSIYWLAKESIANRKILNMLRLLEILGLDQMKYFDHRFSGSLREIFITLGEVMRENVCKSLQSESGNVYGLYVDDVADVSNEEQVVAFIQYFDNFTGSVECTFLFTANILENSDSANAETLYTVIKEQLRKLNIPLGNLRGLATDGASVMTGVRNGLAAMLKSEVKTLVSVHRLCHRLALACVDTSQSLKKIKDLETEVTQLWMVFENSPKKLAMYLKIQKEIKSVKLGNDANNKVAKRLKKACKTRWLSFDKAVEAVISDLPSILMALRELKSDPACYGLLKKFTKAKKIGALYILNAILPVLSTLSKVFQHGTINFANIEPAIAQCQDKLSEIAEEKTPIKKFRDDLDNGLLTEIKWTSDDCNYIEKVLLDYVSALSDNITNRFKNASPVLTAMQVLDQSLLPSKESVNFRHYGHDHIQVIASHFFPDDEHSHLQLLAEWDSFKYNLQAWVLPESVTTYKTMSAVEWVMQRLCKQDFSYNHQYPLLVSVVQSLLVIRFLMPGLNVVRPNSSHQK